VTVVFLSFFKKSSFLKSSINIFRSFSCA
jgi:hypothetical protein